jgi:FAD:protein FMN transferase
MIRDGRPNVHPVVPAAAALLAAVAASLARVPGRAGANGEKSDPRTGDHLVDRYHQTMGTVAHITVWGEDEEVIVKAIDDSWKELDRVDALMTTWTADSEISKINAAAGDGKGVPVSDEVFAILEKALAASKLTSGAFDVTVGSFSGLWKFDEDKDGSIPTKEQVEERRKLVNYKDLILDKKKKTARLKQKGQRITLGGLAKGYGVDRVTEILHKAGLVDFIVQAGGDMFVAGHRGDRKWRVGIRDPRADRDVFFAVAEIEDMTFSTSGDYERYVVKDGVRYHHILDPATGYPATRARSVTVMAKDATTAEGLTKALFIMGPDKGIPWLEGLGLGAEAVIVGPDNKVTISTGLKDKVKIVTQPTDGV